MACYMTVSQSFYQAMKACSSIRIAKKVHAQLISTGFDASVFLQNHLLHTYSACGSIDDARTVFSAIHTPNVFSYNAIINALFDTGRITDAEKLFDEMPHKDSVSWTTMMSGYFSNGRPSQAIRVFVSTVRVYDPFSLTCAMKACGSLGAIALARQLHSLVERLDFSDNMPVQSSLIDMYIKCNSVISAEKTFSRIHSPSLFCWNSMVYGHSKLYGARKAFETFRRMPERDSVSWNTMISVFSHHGLAARSLASFIEMWDHGFRPNPMTYATALSACASLNDVRWGTHLHARIIRTERDLESSFLGNGLIDMYAKCGRLGPARSVFDALKEKNAVSWTSLMRGVAQVCGEEALKLFNRMRRAFVAPDEFTLATVLGVSSTKDFLLVGEQLHGFAIRTGITFSTPVGNSLIMMYSKCGNADKATRVFEIMPTRDIISHTAMISAYSQAGRVEEARECFDKMPERNVVTWNSMLGAYVRSDSCEEALKLYKSMRRSKELNPDSITYATAIGACADLAASNLGTQIVAHAEKLGLGSDVAVANSIVTFYSKCGHSEEARKAFESIGDKNLISWNAIMAGFAQNGEGKKAMASFEEMLRTGCEPDHISFVSVLSVCSHSGLVEEGKRLFASMVEDFGISPTAEHYACVVDMLGRAGLLEEARSLIESPGFKPSPAVWCSLLSACRTRGDSGLAEVAVSRLVELGAEDSGCYALLAGLYSESGHLEAFADARKVMRERGVQKNPGCSWIEVDNRVHVFTADDSDHPMIGDVFTMLSVLIESMKGTGRYSDSVEKLHRELVSFAL